MDKKMYFKDDGTIVMEDELTPELRKELGIDENGNRIDEDGNLIDEDEDDDSREEYVSIDDIARSEGFWIDDDGHWRELPDDDDWY